MEVTDTTGVIKATQSTPAGAVLVPWNPDESWKRDALLRVNAVLGAPTRTHTVYEHVDVMVHPLGVHLVESVATRFWVRRLLTNSSIHSQPSYTGSGEPEDLFAFVGRMSVVV